MCRNEILKKFAKLIVKTGISIKKGQTLIIRSPIECAPFVRIITECAFQEGAGNVEVEWNDELLSKIKYLNAPEDIFDKITTGKKEFYEGYVREGAAFVSIQSPDPELLKDVDPQRISRLNKASMTILKEFYDKLMANKNKWIVVSIPTEAWASKVFPNVSKEDAVEKLWESLYSILRLNKEDPIEAWELQKSNLKKAINFMNSNKFKYLQYKNSLGTNLKIELPNNHLWLGGSDFTEDGEEFMANIPTEEIFTLPHKNGINGTVVSSKPLNYNGNLIENFSLTFKDGKIIKYTAEKGYNTLKNIIETDQGSHYIGEVALVPYDSPISNSGITFFNTLYDENASCHLAIGKAYSVCLKGSEHMNEKELEAAGVNESLLHVDFMLGTKDLNITGITENGEEISVFKNGNWPF